MLNVGKFEDEGVEKGAKREEAWGVEDEDEVGGKIHIKYI